MSSIGFSDLPSELLPGIFKFVSDDRHAKKSISSEYYRFYDLFQASQVSKLWEKQCEPVFKTIYRETFSNNIPNDMLSDRIRYVTICRLFDNVWPFRFDDRANRELGFAVDRQFEQLARFLVAEKKVNPFKTFECVGEFPNLDITIEGVDKYKLRVPKESQFIPTCIASPMEMAVLKADVQMVEILLASENISFKNKALLDTEGLQISEIFEKIFYNYDDNTFCKINKIFALLLKNIEKLPNQLLVLGGFVYENQRFDRPRRMINLPAVAFKALMKNLYPLAYEDECDALVAFYQENTAKKPREDEEGDGNDRPSKKQKVE